MKKTLLTALIAGAVVTLAQAQVTAPAAPASAPAPAPVAAPSAAKKALLDRLVALQQPGLDDLTRSLTMQPVQQMSAFAQQAIGRVPEDKREATITRIEGLFKQYSDEVGPIAKDKATKLGQTALLPLLNERFSEDELRQLLVALENPAFKKYQGSMPEIGNALRMQVVNELRPAVEPKLKTLEQNFNQALGPAASGEPAAPAKGKAPAGGASKPKK
ncbi:hypothetical protein [Rhizobacter sp. Root1221]|uniref:hypothetical protein n=1 Tax=Rhizobacter sp. Root1221 TaxID=1736433 RepID=UPI0006F4F9F1|nr:hypothetical protein [Rhizobacter sp. Root1221]KQV97222.1 hypothetical protein ASC87_23780 [Rhizobacter sp. Root1221]